MEGKQSITRNVLNARNSVRNQPEVCERMQQSMIGKSTRVWLPMEATSNIYYEIMQELRAAIFPKCKICGAVFIETFFSVGR